MRCMDVSYPRRRLLFFRIAKLQQLARRWNYLGPAGPWVSWVRCGHAACTWRVGTRRSLHRSTIRTDRSMHSAGAVDAGAHDASGCQLVKVGAARRVRPCSWAEIHTRRMRWLGSMASFMDRLYLHALFNLCLASSLNHV